MADTNSNSPYQSPQAPLNPSDGLYGAPVVGLSDWLITLIILGIPLVNLIMLFVWGFGSNTNPNRANFCKATLIIYAAIAVLWFLLVSVMGFSLASILMQKS